MFASPATVRSKLLVDNRGGGAQYKMQFRLILQGDIVSERCVLLPDRHVTLQFIIGAAQWSRARTLGGWEVLPTRQRVVVKANMPPGEEH